MCTAIFHIWISLTHKSNKKYNSEHFRWNILYDILCESIQSWRPFTGDSNMLPPIPTPIPHMPPPPHPTPSHPSANDWCNITKQWSRILPALYTQWEKEIFYKVLMIDTDLQFVKIKTYGSYNTSELYTYVYTIEYTIPSQAALCYII